MSTFLADRQIKVMEGYDQRNLANKPDLVVIGNVISRGNPEAEAVLSRALSLEPTNGTARYYMGLMLAQTGRPDTGFRIWDQLLREGPEDAVWIPPILAQIENLAIRQNGFFVYARNFHQAFGLIVHFQIGQHLLVADAAARVVIDDSHDPVQQLPRSRQFAGLRHRMVEAKCRYRDSDPDEFFHSNVNN